MIGESLSPTPRQRAEEILRRLAPVAREALLVMCWMSHDARWFMAAPRGCGMTYRQAFWSRASSVRVVPPMSPQ